jgi:hypothetical protein
MRLEELFYRSVTEFEMTVNLANCLHGAGIRTVGDLIQRTREQLQALSFVPEGETAPVKLHKGGLKEIEKILKEVKADFGTAIPQEVFDRLRDDRAVMEAKRSALQARYEELRQKLPQRAETPVTPLVEALNRIAREAPAPRAETLPDLKSSLEYWEGKVASLERRLRQS